MEQLKQFFQDKSLVNVLDIGTGSGNFIQVLLNTIADVQITGVDPNSDALNEAKEIYPEFAFLEMSGESLQFDDNSFDAASISMALHHLPNVQQTLTEMQRVVKPGGWIIINELYSDNLSPAQEVHKIYHHFRSTVDRILGVTHNPTFTKKEIVTLVRQSGVDIQLMFDHQKSGNLIQTQTDFEERVKKMEEILDEIKDKPEYHDLQNRIEDFKLSANQHGFEMATRIVIVAQVN